MENDGVSVSPPQQQPGTAPISTPPVQPTPTVIGAPAPVPPPKKPILIIAIIVCLLLLLSIGIFVMMSMNQKKSLQASTSTKSTSMPTTAVPTPFPTVTPTPVSDPLVADWQVYSGKDYTFKYPKEWEVYAMSDTAQQDDSSLMIAPKTTLTDELKKSLREGRGGGKDLTMVFTKTTSAIPPEVYESNDDHTVVRRDVMVGANPAVAYTTTWLIELPGLQKGDTMIDTTVSVGDMKYNFELLLPQYKTIYEEILSTIKFTNTTSTQNPPEPQ